VGDSIHRTLKIIALALAFLLLCSVASATTLNVGPKTKYPTIQSAINAAHDGDTIKVAYGTYHENVKINKGGLTLLGTNYPKVDGFYFTVYGNVVNGFSFQKYGISTEFDARPNIIRNNYFYNCGIDLAGAIGDTQIINNQIAGGTISLGDTSSNILIKGTTISKSKRGLWMGNEARLPTVTGCTFKNCEYAVYFTGYGGVPSLSTFYGNKYISNKHNFGWN
jgi:hypothetical protein